MSAIPTINKYVSGVNSLVTLAVKKGRLPAGYQGNVQLLTQRLRSVLQKTRAIKTGTMSVAAIAIAAKLKKAQSGKDGALMLEAFVDIGMLVGVYLTPWVGVINLAACLCLGPDWPKKMLSGPAAIMREIGQHGQRATQHFLFRDRQMHGLMGSVVLGFGKLKLRALKGGKSSYDGRILRGYKHPDPYIYVTEHTKISANGSSMSQSRNWRTRTISDVRPTLKDGLVQGYECAGFQSLLLSYPCVKIDVKVYDSDALKDDLLGKGTFKISQTAGRVSLKLKNGDVEDLEMLVVVKTGQKATAG